MITQHARMQGAGKIGFSVSVDSFKEIVEKNQKEKRGSRNDCGCEDCINVKNMDMGEDLRGSKYEIS